MVKAITHATREYGSGDDGTEPKFRRIASSIPEVPNAEIKLIASDRAIRAAAVLLSSLESLSKLDFDESSFTSI